MIYFTSDLHFGHDRGFIYSPRGFDNIDEHDNIIIQNINSIVKPEDSLYILGDLMLNDNIHGIECLQSIKCRDIHIILGNHDTDARIQLYKEKLSGIDFSATVHGYADMIKYKAENGRTYTFYLSHYPTYTSNLDNAVPLSQHVLNLSGHTHFKTKFYQDIPFIYNVAVDAHNNYPVSVEEVLQDIKHKVEECYAQL